MIQGKPYSDAKLMEAAVASNTEGVQYSPILHMSALHIFMFLYFKICTFPSAHILEVPVHPLIAHTVISGFDL